MSPGITLKGFDHRLPPPFVTNDSISHLDLRRRGRCDSGPGPVHQQLTGVRVDEVQCVFQHVGLNLLQNEQIAANGIFALSYFFVQLLVDPTALGHEQLPEEVGPHRQDVLVRREGAVTSLKRHVVYAVHFVRLVQKTPEVLGEGGRRNAGNLVQTGQRTQDGKSLDL